LEVDLKQLWRIRFTLAMMAGLSLAGFLTDTHLGSISTVWIQRLGFAPSDLWFGRLERLFTSAMVTNGGMVFWQAIGLTLLSVGIVEWRLGSWRALVTFWGIHLATLLVQSWLFVWILKLIGWLELPIFVSARDVGPSAGYFGCLGLICGSLAGRWRWLSGMIGLAILVLALFLPSHSGENLAIELSADLAHLIAFPLGWLSAWIGRREHGIEWRRI
jgi:hypothetical protein